MAWRLFFGIIILLIALGFALDQVTGQSLNFATHLSYLWPILVCAIGLNQLCLHKEQPWGSLVIFALGIIFLVYSLDALGKIEWARENPRQHWGIFLAMLLVVIFAIRMMLPRRVRQFQSHAIKGMAAGTEVRFQHLIKDHSAFSGTCVRNDSQQFQGGSVSSILGDYEIDLRGAALAPTGAEMRLGSFFGTITIHVPQQMALEINGIPVLGGVENSTRQIVTKADGVPTLRLRCLAMFGTIEVSN